MKCIQYYLQFGGVIRNGIRNTRQTFFATVNNSISTAAGVGTSTLFTTFGWSVLCKTYDKKVEIIKFVINSA